MSTVMNDDEVRVNLGRNLSTLLASKGMAQRELARVTGEHPMTISRTARGQNMPSAAALSRIAEALDVSSDWLLANHHRASRKKSS